MIPWDDDGDLLVRRQDVHRILSLANELSKRGITMVHTWKLIQLHNGAGYDHGFVDLFVVDTRDSDSTCVRCFHPWTAPCEYKVNGGYRWWEKYFGFPADWLRERRRYTLGHVTLWGALEAQRLLWHWYGEDCLTSCRTAEYDHKTQRHVTSQPTDCGLLPQAQIKR